MFKISECNDSLFNTCNSCHRSTVSNCSPVQQKVDKIYKVEMKGMFFMACNDCLQQLADDIDNLIIPSR